MGKCEEEDSDVEHKEHMLVDGRIMKTEGKVHLRRKERRD